jgi:hypothetical protein
VIESLFEIVDPPLNASEPLLTKRWSEIENKIGCKLPDDYKIMLSTYGQGKFFDFISFFIPESKNTHLNLIDQISDRIAVYDILKADGEPIPYGFFPAKNGLLPIAGTDNGDNIFFLTEGAPDLWKVVVNESRGEEWIELDMAVSNFLCGLVDGTVKCSIFPQLKFDKPRFTEFHSE